MGMGDFLWGRDGDGENFMGTGWGWGKFYGDGAVMGTILFTVSLSNKHQWPNCRAEVKCLGTGNKQQ